MPIEPMLTEETPREALVARVLDRGRDRDGLWHFRRPYRPHHVRAQPSTRTRSARCMVREESLGGVMAEVYGRLTRRPGVMLGQGPWVLGNGLIGTIEAHSVELADAAVDRFQRRPAVHPACALSAGDRRLGQLGRAPRLWRRHQAGHAGARPDRRGAGDPARRSSMRSPGSRGRWRSSTAMTRWPGRSPRIRNRMLYPTALLSAAACRRRPSRRRSRPRPRAFSPREGR